MCIFFFSNSNNWYSNLVVGDEESTISLHSAYNFWYYWANVDVPRCFLLTSFSRTGKKPYEQGDRAENPLFTFVDQVRQRIDVRAFRRHPLCVVVLVVWLQCSGTLFPTVYELNVVFRLSIVSSRSTNPYYRIIFVVALGRVATSSLGGIHCLVGQLWIRVGQSRKSHQGWEARRRPLSNALHEKPRHALLPQLSGGQEPRTRPRGEIQGFLARPVVWAL